MKLTRRRVLALLSAASAGSLVGACASAAREPATQLPAELGSIEGFLAAVVRGDRGAVEGLLDADATLATARDSTGRSAYVLAHVHGHAEVAGLLRSRGIELDIVEAVLATDWERVESLAAAHPGVMNAAHPIGGNPLYASGLVGGGEQYRLRSLGSDSDGRPAGGTGFTPARAAMDCVDPIGAWLAATDILSNGGDVNAEQANGDSVLHAAVRRRDARLVRLALRKGADVSARDAAGRTPTDMARSAGWAAGQTLLEDSSRVARDHRASQFAFNQSRESFALDPLEGISQAQQSEITGVSHFNPKRVRELLAAEPRLVHSISTDDELAIEACGHTGQREVIRIHLDHGAPLSLPTAISLGDLAHARWLLQGDPLLVHERGPHDFPVMWYPAIGGGSVEAAELLLEAGTPIDQESGGATVLHSAAARGHVDLVRFLVERGAAIDAVGYRDDRSGWTALQTAEERGRDEVVKVLKELGAA